MRTKSLARVKKSAFDGDGKRQDYRIQSAGSLTPLRRREFQASLQLVYFTFSQWRHAIEDLRREQSQLEQLACRQRDSRCVRIVVDAWKQRVLRRQLQARYWVDAVQFDDSACQNRYFLQWKRWSKLRCEIDRRRHVIDTRLVRCCVGQWADFVTTQRILSARFEKAQRNRLRWAIKRFQRNTQQLKARRFASEKADSHHETILQAAAFAAWKNQLLLSPERSLSLRCAKIAGLKTGIRRWSHFLQSRRQRAHQQLQADVHRYHGLLKVMLCRWRQHQAILRRRRDAWATAEEHYMRSLACRALRYWLRHHRSRVNARTQVANATQWHHQRLVMAIFGLWRKKTRLNALSSQLQDKRKARQTALVLLCWRRWAEQSRINRCKCISVQTHRRRVVLSRTWSTWREAQRKSVIISSLLLRRRCCALTQHIIAWRDVARSSRRYRCSVLRMRAESSERTLRLALKAWSSTTLRRRCCNQLAKLFRKKTRRRLLERTFRLLRVSVRCSQQQRKEQHELLRRAFFKCRSFATFQKSDRARDQLASAYFRARQCSLAVDRWTLACQTQKKYREATLTALKHLYNGILRQSLHQWYLLARRLRRREDMLNARRVERDLKVLRSMLWAWCILARERRQRELQTRMAKRQHIDRQHRLVWQAWLQFTRNRQDSRHLTLVAAASHAQRCCSRAISSWHKSAKTLRKLRIQRERVRETLMHKRLSSAVVVWRWDHRRRMDRRRQLIMSAAFYNETLLCRSLLMWQAFWYSEVMKRDRRNAAVGVLMRKRLRSAIKTWYSRSMVAKSTRQDDKQADSHHNHILSRRGIDRWLNTRKRQQQRRSKRMLAISHNNKSVLRQVLELWKYYTSQQHTLKTQLQRIFRSECQFALRLVFDKWKRYRRTSTLHRHADGFRNRALRRNVWRRWSAHCQFVAKMTKNTLVTGRLLRANSLRAAFVAWQTFISLRCQHQSCLDAADSTFRHNQYRRGVRCWKTFHQRLQREEAALQFALARLRRHFFQRWRGYFVRVGEKERIWNHVGEWRRNKVLSVSWMHWATTSCRAVQERLGQSDMHFHKVLTTKMWTSWRLIIDWAHIAVVIRSRRTAAFTRSAWIQWLSFLVAKAERKRQYSKSVAYYRLTQRSRAWNAWLEYLKHCDLKYSQYERAREHYKTHIVCRRSLSAWIRFTSCQRVRQQRLLLAADHFQSARLQSGFRRWVSYRNLRVTHRQQESDHRRRIVGLLLSRSVAKWQTQTRGTARRYEAQQLSMTHYRNRRLAAALTAFRLAREEIQLARRQRGQAMALLKTRLLTQCFRQWISYHSWRKRNQRLVCLFRESRKGEHFFRWKAFWSCKKAKAAQTLKAHTVYCTRSERRSFLRWVEYVITQRQKARAYAFYTGQITRQSLLQWKRRVRVVRQMRRLVRSQASFRLEAHFSAWQRFVCARKHLMQRFEHATAFMSRSRVEKHWAHWLLFVARQREERAVVRNAERFRRQFITWKMLHSWRTRACYWSRKRVLGAAAAQSARTRSLGRVMDAWASWLRQRNALRSLQARFAANAKRGRIMYAISMLTNLVTERRAVKALRARADRHWRQRIWATCWKRWLDWLCRSKTRQSQVLLADSRSRQTILSRYFAAMIGWSIRTKATRSRLSAFRRRFLVAVVARCFGRWRSVSVLRRELRLMVHRTNTHRRLALLLRWRRNAACAVKRRAQRETADSYFRGRQLARWFLHWESVGTDRWTARRLVQLHRQDRKRMLVAKGVARWRAAVGERRHARLAMALRAWQVAVDGTRVCNT